MGGRKQRRPVRTRPKPSLPKIFDCPRCEASAIRISIESDIAIIECGSCHLKQTLTEVKSIEEAVDIYGNFLDNYYIQLESSDQDLTTESELNPEISLGEESVSEIASESEIEPIHEAVEEISEVIEEEIKEEPQTGFILRSKGDVLKNKQKPKEKKKKSFDLSSFNE